MRTDIKFQIKGIVTTPRKRDDLEARARETAARIGIPFEPRRERAFGAIMKDTGAEAVYVETQDAPLIQTAAGPVFFHEGTAVVRTKRPGNGISLAESLGLSPGGRLLDATLGLATDALTAACFMQGGKVTGVESSQMLADVVARGLREYTFTTERLREAASRIEVVREDHAEFLRGCADGEYDVVYFDPMFDVTVERSTAMRRLKELADPGPLLPETVREARRVAAKRVVVKARRGCFGAIEFTEVRPSGKSIIYGIIET